LRVDFLERKTFSIGKEKKLRREDRLLYVLCLVSYVACNTR
jgi:hypothetical protein